MSEKSPLLINLNFDVPFEQKRLEASLAGRPVINLDRGQGHGNLTGIKYALVWRSEAKLLNALVDLEILFSAGAGVDHIFCNENIPNVPIVRFVDPTMTARMGEWVCLQCLSHLRQSYKYASNQRTKIWHELPQPQAGEIRVGIMGMGVLGQDCAAKLTTLGFQVNGWSRNKKNIEGIKNFGEQDLDQFLSETDFLVGLLPLTKDTEGIFNRRLFGKLARNDDIAAPVFINAGRGASHVEPDIITCLDDGTLGGVSLDVFEKEPLPPQSRLWGFEQAILTPHAAAVSDIGALGRHVEAQLQRYEAGKQVEYLVDREQGY